MTPEFEKLHRLMTDAKCSLMLNNARKRIKHTISNDEYHSMKLDNIDVIIKNQMIKNLSSSVVNEVYNKIKKEDLIVSKSYELDVVVIPTEDLKSVVDYLIQNMPLEDILRIREYGKEDEPFKL
jgi:asparagine synthetase A